MIKTMILITMFLSCYVTQTTLSNQREYETTEGEYRFSFNNDKYLAYAIDSLERGLDYASVYIGMQEHTWGRAILKSLGLMAGSSCVKHVLYALTRSNTGYSITLSAANEAGFKEVQSKIKQLAWISKKQKKLILKTIKNPTGMQPISVTICKNKAITEPSFCGVKVTETSYRKPQEHVEEDYKIVTTKFQMR